MWVVLQNRVPFRLLFTKVRVPYYFGDPRRDPNLENYPKGGGPDAERGGGVGISVSRIQDFWV